MHGERLPELDQEQRDLLSLQPEANADSMPEGASDSQKVVHVPHVIIVGNLSDEARAEVVRVATWYDESLMAEAAYN